MKVRNGTSMNQAAAVLQSSTVPNKYDTNIPIFVHT